MTGVLWDTAAGAAPGPRADGGAMDGWTVVERLLEDLAALEDGLGW